MKWFYERAALLFLAFLLWAAMPVMREQFVQWGIRFLGLDIGG